MEILPQLIIPSKEDWEKAPKQFLLAPTGRTKELNPKLFPNVTVNEHWMSKYNWEEIWGLDSYHRMSGLCDRLRLITALQRVFDRSNWPHSARRQRQLDHCNCPWITRVKDSYSKLLTHSSLTQSERDCSSAAFKLWREKVLKLFLKDSHWFSDLNNKTTVCLFSIHPLIVTIPYSFSREVLSRTKVCSSSPHVFQLLKQENLNLDEEEESEEELRCGTNWWFNVSIKQTSSNKLKTFNLMQTSDTKYLKKYF